MVAPLPEIQRDLSKLQEKGQKLRAEFIQAYEAYLAVLNESVQTQLVLVCFNLCTERHGKEFLKLSLTQRQTLQQDLQKLGVELGQALMQQLNIVFTERPSANETPITLLVAVGQVEQQLASCLRKTSLAINRLLEQHHILHIKSLDTLFEIAAKAEEAGRSITNPPLLLKAIVDMTEEEEEDGMQPLTAIYLQLADLEFADSKLLGARQPLRQLMQKLQGLQQQYSQKLEEEIVAEAIAAWRASWYSYTPDSSN